MNDGHFVEAAAAYGVDSVRDARGLAVADFDGDGDLDLIVSNYNKPANYYVNEKARGHWLKVRLRGHRSNRDGIGAIIRIRTGERKQMRVISAGDGFASQNSRVAHFGLGSFEVIDEIQIDWPRGLRQSLRSVSANQLIVVDELE